MGADLRARDGERRRSPERARPLGRRDGDRVHLTDRQAEVLELVAAGLENKQIAAKLGVSEQAVKQQVSVLLRKFDVPSRAMLVQEAMTMRLLGRRMDASDAPLEHFFDRAPVMMALLRGPEHRYALVNREYVRFFGERDYIGHTIRECFPEVDPAAEAAAHDRLDQVYGSGEPWRETQAMWTLLRDGVTVEVSLTFTIEATRDAGGAVNGLAIYGWDVTDQIAMRRRLERLSTEQQVLLEELPVGVVYLDARGHATLVNPVARRLLAGIDPAVPMADQAPGWNVRLAETGERLTPETAVSARAMRGLAFDGKVRITHPADGATMTLRVIARPLHDAHGAVTGATMIISEVNGAD